MRYETESMRQMRRYLERQGIAPSDIDGFKRCLVALERVGFTLSGPRLDIASRAD